MGGMMHRHEWVSIDGTIFAQSAARPGVMVCLEDGEQYTEAAPCQCTPCHSLRTDMAGYTGLTACFTGMGPSRGKCIDPWGQGCTCDRPSGDGDCEGCWLWRK